MILYFHLWLAGTIMSIFSLVSLDIVCGAAVIGSVYFIYKSIVVLKDEGNFSRCLSMLIGIAAGFGSSALAVLIIINLNFPNFGVEFFVKCFLIVSITVFASLIISSLFKKYISPRGILYIALPVSFLPILSDAYGIWFLIDRNW